MQVIICYLQKMVVQMSAMIGFVRRSVQILLRGIEVGGGQTQEDWAKINRFGGFDEMTSNFAENAITLAGTAINFAMNAIWSFLERYSPFQKRRMAKGIDRSDFSFGGDLGASGFDAGHTEFSYLHDCRCSNHSGHCKIKCKCWSYHLIWRGPPGSK